jgi:hypothetical protein
MTFFPGVFSMLSLLRCFVKKDNEEEEQRLNKSETEGVSKYAAFFQVQSRKKKKP